MKLIASDEDLNTNPEAKEEDDDHSKKIAHNPFVLCGYGVNSYFNIMIELMIMFCVITIFLLPLFAIYSTNSA